MQITLSPDDQLIIEQEMRDRRLTSPEAVVHEALKLIQERPYTLEQLRTMVDEAAAEIDRGEETAWDPEDIKREGRRRLAEWNQKQS